MGSPVHSRIFLFAPTQLRQSRDSMVALAELWFCVEKEKRTSLPEFRKRKLADLANFSGPFWTGLSVYL